MMLKTPVSIEIVNLQHVRHCPAEVRVHNSPDSREVLDYPQGNGQSLVQMLAIDGFVRSFGGKSVMQILRDWIRS